MVRDFVKSSGVQAGFVIVSSLHTTCAILINEWQDALVHDVKAYLARADQQRRATIGIMIRPGRIAIGTMPIRTFASLMLGMILTLQIADGDVVLGEWQSIIMAELDGPRERSIRLQAMGIASRVSRKKETNNAYYADQES